MMAAMDQSERLSAAKTGILNILVALVFIKVIDFIYFIAQEPDFTTRASDLVLRISQLMGRLIGAALLWSIIYAGYLMIADSGSGESATKAKNVIVNVFVIGVVIFLFLLIVYQLIAQFA